MAIVATSRVGLEAYGKEEGITVSKLWDEVRQEGKAEEIVSMGEEFQLPREAILKRLQEKLGVGIQQA